MNTRLIGVQGEDLAAKHLKKCGYTILERNFSCRLGEIDIIAQYHDYIVFIEVKSRNTHKFGAPREAVTPYKQGRIVSGAKYWLVKNGKTGAPVRFDVVEVAEGVVSVITDAFRP